MVDGCHLAMIRFDMASVPGITCCVKETATTKVILGRVQNLLRQHKENFENELTEEIITSIKILHRGVAIEPNERPLRHIENFDRTNIHLMALTTSEPQIDGQLNHDDQPFNP